MRAESRNDSSTWHCHDTGNNNRNALLRDPDGNLVEIVAKVTPG